GACRPRTRDAAVCAVAPLVSARTARAGPFLWAADVLGLERESRVAAKLDELGIVSARIARRCCADGTCVTTSRARPRRAQAVDVASVRRSRAALCIGVADHGARASDTSRRGKLLANR